MRIYLAGKISKKDWRDEILEYPGAHRDNMGCWGTFPEPEWDWKIHGWPVSRGSVLGKHDYVGPFFLADDHGCYHGPASHGAGLTVTEWEEEEEGEWVQGGNFFEAPYSRRFVISLCFKAIWNADLVFAWLSEATCYGTLVELGFAAAKGIPIAVAIPAVFSESQEMWFAKEIARHVVEYAQNPKEALQSVLANFCPRQDKSENGLNM
jgi:hypothetical protein